MKASMGPLIALLVIGLAVAVYFIYTGSFQETTKIVKALSSIPSYVDLEFSFGESGKLPTKYIDLRKSEYTFPILLRNSFEKQVTAKICPSISLETSGKYSKIDGECLDFTIEPGKSDGSNVAIPISSEDKSNLCAASKIVLNISIEYDGALKSLAELDIDQGYPTHQNSKTSSLQINPMIQPNPINSENDKEFSLSLSVKKFAVKLTIDKIIVTPIETKIITKKGTYEKTETIGIDGGFTLEEEHDVLLPDEIIDMRTLPAPYIKVTEAGTVSNIPLNCDSELAKQLKVCELKTDQDVAESFKKMYIEIEVSFTARRYQTENLYIDKTQCTS